MAFAAVGEVTWDHTQQVQQRWFDLQRLCVSVSPQVAAAAVANWEIVQQSLTLPQLAQLDVKSLLPAVTTPSSSRETPLEAPFAGFQAPNRVHDGGSSMLPPLGQWTGAGWSFCTPSQRTPLSDSTQSSIPAHIPLALPSAGSEHLTPSVGGLGDSTSSAWMRTPKRPREDR